jgi:hypothetical protein
VAFIEILRRIQNEWTISFGFAEEKKKDAMRISMYFFALNASSELNFGFLATSWYGRHQSHACNATPAAYILTKSCVFFFSEESCEGFFTSARNSSLSSLEIKFHRSSTKKKKRIADFEVFIDSQPCCVLTSYLYLCAVFAVWVSRHSRCRLVVCILDNLLACCWGFFLLVCLAYIVAWAVQDTTPSPHTVEVTISAELLAVPM